MNDVYEIFQGDKSVLSFPNEAGMRKYLEGERDLWMPFLEAVSKNGWFSGLSRQYGGSISADEFTKVYDRLLTALETPRKFSEAQGRHSRHNLPLPPASSSVEGRLILSLMESTHHSAAMAAFLSFLKTNRVFVSAVTVARLFSLTG